MKMSELETSEKLFEPEAAGAQPSIRSFISQNQQEFAALLTFIDFAEGLTIGFVEVNQEEDKTLLAGALRESLSNTDSRLEVMFFSRGSDLRRLRDALIRRFCKILLYLRCLPSERAASAAVCAAGLRD